MTSFFFRNPGKKIPGRRTIRLAGRLLAVVVTVALTAPLLCNEKPIYVRYNGENLFPAISTSGYADVVNIKTRITERLVYSTVDWQALNKEKVIWCPVIYSPGKSDWSNAGYKSPFGTQYFSIAGTTVHMPARFRHWLGTTKTGADVLSGLIYGARISLTVGIFSMLIAGFIGIALGIIAGYFGDYKIIVSKAGIYTMVFLGLPLSWFYGFYLNRFIFRSILNSSALGIAGFIVYMLVLTGGIILLFYAAGNSAGRLLNYRKKTFLRVDQYISRSIEVFNSIPRIVLIITLAAVARPSVLNLVLIIGFTSWTEITRLVRAEMLRVRESEYIQSGEASGVKTIRLLLRHALPNVLTPAITAVTLGVASAVLTESALSFLGIGVPGDVVTWGSLLSEGKQAFSAWWLVLFPGIAIFTTVSVINILGDNLRDSMNPGINK